MINTAYRNEHSYCGPISMLKKLANGDIVLVFREALRRDFRTHGDPTTRASMVRSTDGGNTWHTLVSPNTFGANGVSVNQISNGDLLVNLFRWVFVPLELKDDLKRLGDVREVESLGMAMAVEGIHVSRSTDNGYTWACPIRMDTAGFDCRTAGRVVELSDGTLLMPLREMDKATGKWRANVRSSRDRGKTWSVRGVIKEGQAPL